MSNNFTILAQNSITDYVEQAYLCAMSIRPTDNDCKIVKVGKGIKYIKTNRLK